MPNNSDIYKSFTVKPCAAYEYPKGKKLRDLSLLSTGDLIPTDLEDVKRKISKDVTTITDLTEWFPVSYTHLRAHETGRNTTSFTTYSE